MADLGLFTPQTAKYVLETVNEFHRQQNARFGEYRTSNAPIFIKNISGEEIPAYACMQVVAVEEFEDRLYMHVNKPLDRTGYNGPFLFNGKDPLEDEKRGIGFAGPVGRVLSEVATPDTGDKFSPKIGEWFVECNPIGIFIATGEDVELLRGNSRDIIKVVITEHATEHVIALTPAGGIAAREGSTITFESCQLFKVVGDDEDETWTMTDTEKTGDVGNYSTADLPGGTYVLAHLNAGGHLITGDGACTGFIGTAVSEIDSGGEGNICRCDGELVSGTNVTCDSIIAGCKVEAWPNNCDGECKYDLVPIIEIDVAGLANQPVLIDVEITEMYLIKTYRTIEYERTGGGDVTCGPYDYDSQYPNYYDDCCKKRLYWGETFQLDEEYPCCYPDDGYSGNAPICESCPDTSSNITIDAGTVTEGDGGCGNCADAGGEHTLTYDAGFEWAESDTAICDIGAQWKVNCTSLSAVTIYEASMEVSSGTWRGVCPDDLAEDGVTVTLTRSETPASQSCNVPNIITMTLPT